MAIVRDISISTIRAASRRIHTVGARTPLLPLDGTSGGNIDLARFAPIITETALDLWKTQETGGSFPQIETRPL